jgi:hypothetical protein
MFCANILYHSTSFDSKTSLAGNIALTVGISSSTEKHGLFFRLIACTKLKRFFFENLATKQCNSPQYCTKSP